MSADGRTTDTKQKLFLAALELFAEKGVDGTSIRDIVNAVGVSTAAFYNHFKSKDALLQALYNDYVKSSIQEQSFQWSDVERLVDEKGPLDAFREASFRFISAMNDPVCAKLVKIISMEKDKNPVAAEISFQDRMKVVTLMEEFFLLLQKKGYVRGKNARLRGRMFGYIQLAFSVENTYRFFMKKEPVEKIVKEQNKIMLEFLTEMIGGEG